jgi:hypothetical protein
MNVVPTNAMRLRWQVEEEGKGKMAKHKKGQDGFKMGDGA